MKTRSLGPARQRGVTIIETVVVTTIAAILFSQAVPLFSTWIGNSQTRTAAESILNGVQLARGEAIRRNRMVQISLTAGALPSWTVGCANPIDNGTPNVDDAGDCLAVIRARPSAESSDQPQLTVLPVAANTVTFDSLGRIAANVDGSATPVSIDVANPGVNDNERRVLRLVMGAAGDVRMCDPAIVNRDPRGC